jgi:hypothetical protein
MPDLGVRLQLMIGPTVPVPAPFEVIDALTSVEVTDNDRERDGFQMSFSLGKNSLLEYGLLQSGILDPSSRVIMMVIIGGTPQVLMDGMITNHQVVPSNKPGESTLVVTGEDISLAMDLVERSDTYPNQTASSIVTKIVSSYGLEPAVTATDYVNSDNHETQQGTDLAYIQKLAQDYSFIFYVEPTNVPGVNIAYWGVDNRLGEIQPALTMNMGPDTNVDSQLTFSFNALGPAKPQLSILEPTTGLSIPIPIPSALEPTLSSHPTSSMRITVSRDTANLSFTEALRKALTTVSSSLDAVTATGEVDAVRYGRVLRARRLVGVRGVGNSYDGVYYVKQVTHRIKRGEYKQSFTLVREGLGASRPTLVS